MSIPNEYHFIFGLTPTDMPFSLVHYLAVASCRMVNSPHVLNFYYKYEPSGFWWELTKPLVHLVPIEPPEEIFGNVLAHPAHKADVLRLQILLEHGGVYLDLDVICLRPFAALHQFSLVMGEQLGSGLCNAVILARPNSRFIERWLSEYHSFSSRKWDSHSVVLPARLATEMPDEIHVLSPQQLFWPNFSREDLISFFLHPRSNFTESSYSVHLWSSRTWAHIGRLTPAHVWQVDSEFCTLVRSYVRPEWILDPPSKNGDAALISPSAKGTDDVLKSIEGTRLALARLPARAREVAILGHLQGGSREEMSMLLGLSLAEIDSLMQETQSFHSGAEDRRK